MYIFIVYIHCISWMLSICADCPSSWTGDNLIQLQCYYIWVILKIGQSHEATALDKWAYLYWQIYICIYILYLNAYNILFTNAIWLSILRSQYKANQLCFFLKILKNPVNWFLDMCAQVCSIDEQSSWLVHARLLHWPWSLVSSISAFT